MRPLFRHRSNLREARLCQKYKIAILGYFISSHGEVESVQYRIDLPKRIEELGIPLPFFNVLTPLNETPLYYTMLRNKQIPKDYWKEFCENLVRNWVIPRYHRSLEEEKELRAIVDNYVNYFFRKRESMLKFVS